MKHLLLIVLLSVWSLAFCQCSNDSLVWLNSQDVQFGNGQEIPCLPKTCNCDSMTQVAMPSLQGSVFVVTQNPTTMRLIVIENCNTVLLDTCLVTYSSAPTTALTLSMDFTGISFWLCSDDSIPYNVYLSMKIGTAIHGIVPDSALFTIDTLCPILDSPQWEIVPQSAPKEPKKHRHYFELPLKYDHQGMPIETFILQPNKKYLISDY